MPGEARTSKVILSEATIMVGPRADVFDLTPAKHSLGLSKQVKVDVTHGFAELTQGVTQQVAFSVNNSIESVVNAEIYEFTARNLAYAAQIDATGTAFDEAENMFSLGADFDDADTTLTLGTGEGTSVAAGDYLVVQRDKGDTVAVVKVASVATDVVTLATGFGAPTGETFTALNSRVFRVRKPITVGETDSPLYGIKLVGVMPENRRPITLIFPKVRMQKGLMANFDASNFSSMPFEFKPLALLTSDAHYAELPGNKQFMILPA